MTTLGSLVKAAPKPFDVGSLVASLNVHVQALHAAGTSSVQASIQAWTEQDDDAHEPCSLTACRHPLHPGPCKGWKGTLHSVSPGTYKQIEEERVRKANDRRVKRIADLRSQGKPIPRRLLTEIKPKPAPTHAAHNASTVPLGQVNQKADLAGGQAHTAGQNVSKAAGVKVSTAPLPLGPKKQKPTVAGRGPAFVITQPKVTDQYKLGKADQITPQQWDALSDADKTTIRNELTAIKARGFGPQQKKSDELLAKLPAPGAHKQANPATNPGSTNQPTPQTPSATPGRTTLGQATKTIPPASTATQGRAAAVAQANAALAITEALHGKQSIDPAKLATSIDVMKSKGDLKDQQGFKLLVDRLANDALSKASAANMPGLGHGANDVGIADFNHAIRDHIADGKPGVPPLIQRVKDAQTAKAAPATKAPTLPSPGPAPAQPLAPGALGNIPAGSTVAKVSIADVKVGDLVKGNMVGGTHTVAKIDLSNTSLTNSHVTYELKDASGKTFFVGNKNSKATKVTPPTPGVSGTPPTPAKAAPASSPSAPSAGPTPQAPGPPNNTPQAFPPHMQHARAVAGRAVGRPTSKTHVDAYGKLSKADFDGLDTQTQRTIRDDLANAKAKFLDPKKAQVASDLLDRFGSRHAAPAGPAAPSATTTMTPTNVATLIRKNGSVDLMLGGKKVTVGFQGGGHDGTMVMAPGGHYVVTTKDGTKHDLAKGQRVTVATAAPATATAPAAPNAKGYSDPQNEAVKAASSGLISNDDVIKTAGRLSLTSIGQLDDADRKKIIGRLAFVATHPKAEKAQKEKAAALKRIIEDGSPAQATGKWDHTPTIAELHAEEKKDGSAKAALAVADALKAADAKSGLAPGTQHADRVKALSGLSKVQFDALKPEEQRKITDALHELHTTRTGAVRGTTLDPLAEAAIEHYTGLHPGIHLMRQAEADFRAGKIDGDAVHTAFVHARVAAPSKYGDPSSPGARLAKEAQRVAEDNPKLPIWHRAAMIENEYGGPTYASITRAASRYDHDPAPRVSSSDISDIFRATVDDMATAHPIHQEAVKALRLNLLTTGLRGDPGVPTGSPWSTATRSHVVDNLLHLTGSDTTVPPERLKEFQALPPGAQANVLRVMRERLSGQSNDHAKVTTHLLLRELTDTPKSTSEVEAALKAATDRYAADRNADIYRRLDPADFQAMPDFAQRAIETHLDDIQARTARSGPVSTWTPQDNALKVMPLALKAHLGGLRPRYADRSERNAADIANYGTGIVNPLDRSRAYGLVPIGRFQTMTSADRLKIENDLDKISHDPGNSLQVRYGARVTRDVRLSSTLNGNQALAVRVVDPNPTTGFPDQDVVQDLHLLSKADFDSLDPTFKDAIDARVKMLPGADQQALTAKFHPNAVPANPSGTVPTSVQPNVPPHVQTALDTIYGVHPKSHTMAHQLATYGALRGSDFAQLNGQEQNHLLSDLSFIQTTAKGPSAIKAGKLIDRFTPPGTPAGTVPTPAIIPPANALPGQVRYATPLKGLEKATVTGKNGDRWITLPGGQRVWGEYGASGLMLQHVDKQTGEKRYLMVQRGPAISDPGKWTFPGGASESKETPHQGATRETIEELGLKDDVFKDALVHGDFTYSVPNSTWKYTSVAVQVPEMIKPNLSTAHARAETSDAKWMTEAEIRALDVADKLHHPIAGGKLEQNVLSLFPQTPHGGNTLGQIVRPGPVNKRLKRLNLPSGGRQAPAAAANAWTAPHKPSKGKNLIPDKASFDAQRQKLKQDRKLYDGKTADGRLAAIGAQQGFDDTPTVVDKDEIDRLLATGDYIEAWRGVTGAGGHGGWRSRGGHGGKTAADINEEMRTGPAYYGKGIFGNGYYLATRRSVAQQYADGTTGSVVRMLIPKSALTEKYDKVSAESFASGPRMSKAKGAGYGELSTFYDPGRYAAAKGLDGIEIEAHHRSPSGGAGHVASHGKPAFNWLNRSVLIVQKEAG